TGRVRTRQKMAEFGRFWQNRAERYSLVPVQTFQYSVNKGIIKNEEQKTMTRLMAVIEIPYFIPSDSA
ncbi:MAG: hypothetical protein JXA11_14985, partial [Phycisphaerae bacterium]|nr:hypothetical protein [Phycisphaerae bacterium]